MYLLAHFEALPALPISILLAMAAFFIMVNIAQAYIEFLTIHGIS